MNWILKHLFIFDNICLYHNLKVFSNEFMNVCKYVSRYYIWMYFFYIVIYTDIVWHIQVQRTFWLQKKKKIL